MANFLYSILKNHLNKLTFLNTASDKSKKVATTQLAKFKEMVEGKVKENSKILAQSANILVAIIMSNLRFFLYSLYQNQRIRENLEMTRVIKDLRQCRTESVNHAILMTEKNKEVTKMVAVFEATRTRMQELHAKELTDAYMALDKVKGPVIEVLEKKYPECLATIDSYKNESKYLKLKYRKCLQENRMLNAKVVEKSTQNNTTKNNSTKTK